jgi:hypothetical protein
MATKKKVLDVLRTRYDYYASEAVLTELMENARVSGEDGFAAKDLKKLADALARSGNRSDSAVSALNELAATEKDSAKPAAEKKAEPAKKPAAKKAAKK